MADNLPRPATPGPWRLGEYDRLDDSVSIVSEDGTPVAYVYRIAGAAIHSLPERIRRMDGIRRVAEDGLDYEPTAYQQGYAAACQAVLRWLNGEVE